MPLLSKVFFFILVAIQNSKLARFYLCFLSVVVAVAFYFISYFFLKGDVFQNKMPQV